MKVRVRVKLGLRLEVGLGLASGSPVVYVAPTLLIAATMLFPVRTSSLTQEVGRIQGLESELGVGVDFHFAVWVSVLQSIFMQPLSACGVCERELMLYLIRFHLGLGSGLGVLTR